MNLGGWDSCRNAVLDNTENVSKFLDNRRMSPFTFLVISGVMGKVVNRLGGTG